MSHAQQVDVLASHSMLLAIPAFVPALAVVGVIVAIAMRDRRAERREGEQAAPDAADSIKREER
ncbi:hypothetical protein DFR70_1021066 [Nocardia tenerifensis]|uniref:Secreted protein with PEP-CTERM sorting signal n=1 Tax=Nocardia tenerifensis TaxID=228006 RepID=A0A318KLP6_9NOCA|nr:hypothetical protein [Nocardia tenerifensis]PXX69377.1 hypothetical protein DFR70_1021066 [Nocardia tenerifensis]